MDPLARAGAALSAETPADRARRLLEGATPGPWRVSDRDSIAPAVSGRWLVAVVHGDDDGRPWNDEIDPGPGPMADAELIAAAPDLARDLIAEVEAHEVTRAALADALRERPHLRGGYDTMAGALGMFPGATPEQVVEFVIRLGAAAALHRLATVLDACGVALSCRGGT